MSRLGKALEFLIGPPLEAPAPSSSSSSEIERATVWEAHEWLSFHPDLAPTPFSTVDQVQAAGIPAFYRAMRIKADLISTLPLRAELGGRRLEVVPALLERPDPTQDRQLTLATMAGSIVLRGEAVAVLGSFDDDGYPGALKVVDPRAATLQRDGSWKIGERGFGPDEILHICPFLLPGETRGRGAVELHRCALAGEILASEYQRGFYADNAQPSVKINVSGREYSIDEMTELEAWWISKMRGRRKPVVLPDGIDAEAMALSNEDSQFIQTRQFSLGEIAMIVGIPAYFVGGGTAGMTYANVVDERRNLLDIHLRADLYSLERGFTRLLPGGVDAKFDPTSFLRLDPKGTVEMLVAQTWLSDDEKRAVMGYDPIGASTASEPTLSPFELAEMLQKIYLAVGKVISADEAREIVNKAGAGLTGPAPEPAPASSGGF